MASANTGVTLSRTIGEASLNLNIKAYQARRTLAAVWDLKSTDGSPPESAEAFLMTNPGEESVVGDDERSLVDKAHFKAGGKYRSIVKIFSNYEFQKPGSSAMLGTGWLITPDIFVTAGHCCYDWGHKYGRATEVKAYIGYNGRDSIKDPDVQFRYVKRIVTTEGWVKTKGQKAFDVSFMQVNKPFTGVTPIKFEETPRTGNLVLGVVGYPGDLIDERTGERGAHMYEMFLKTPFDLAEEPDTMLQYQIDTYGGNSGSPVLRNPDLVSIGTHVYGGRLNSASVIGKYGNPYYDYITAFDLKLPNETLHLVPVSSSSAIPSSLSSGRGPSSQLSTNKLGLQATRTPTRDGAVSRGPSALSSQDPTKFSQRGFAQDANLKVANRYQQGIGISGGVSARDQDDEEGFLDILKSVASVALPVVGGPIGALAGFALNAASAVAAESTDAEAVAENPILHEGTMERAILAEAALTVLQSGGLSHELEEGIFGDMKDAVMRAWPTVRKTAPRVVGAMMEPALKMALDSLHNYNKQATSGAEGFDEVTLPFNKPLVYSAAIDVSADDSTEAFLDYMQASLQQNLQEGGFDGETEEGFFDIIKAGARLAGKGVLFAAQHGLPLLQQALSNAEGLDLDAAGPIDENATSEQLAARALVADAALQAVMRLPPDSLQQEGFFDNVFGVVKKIAPIALKAAPTIAGLIHPTAGRIVSGILGQESVAAGEVGRRDVGSRRLAPSPALSGKRSFTSLRQNPGRLGNQAASNDRQGRLGRFAPQ